MTALRGIYNWHAIPPSYKLIHELISPWCRIYASLNSAIIGSGNGLSSSRSQAITWTSAGLLWAGLLGTNLSEIWIGNHHQENAFGYVICQKWRPYFPGRDEFQCIPRCLWNLILQAFKLLLAAKWQLQRKIICLQAYWHRHSGKLPLVQHWWKSISNFLRQVPFINNAQMEEDKVVFESL